jgi:hypothetical protein
MECPARDNSLVGRNFSAVTNSKKDLILKIDIVTRPWGLLSL